VVNWITSVKSFRWWLVAIVVMMVLPFIVPPSFLRICIMANFMAIFAMSWDMMSGYTGYVSFGHPFLIGLAGYVSAMLSHQGGFQPPHIVLPLYVTMPLGIAAAVGGGMLFFLPSMRVRGPYFSLISLAFLMILSRIMIAAGAMTGGDRGLTSLPYLVTGAVNNYWLSTGIMFAVAIGLWLVARSDVGHVLKAIRMDEDVVESSGLSTYRFKRFAFILSAITAGIGGVFYTHYMGSISPAGAFDYIFLLNIIVSTVVGGMGTILGPIFGGYFITFFTESTRTLLEGAWRFMAYSLVALAIVYFRPGGFYGIVHDIAAWFRAKRRGGLQYDQVT